MSRYNPLPFSPEYAFTAMRPMQIAGVSYAAGDPIDASAISQQRLRQLYDARKIAPHAPDFLFNGAGEAPATPANGQDQSAGGADGSTTVATPKKPRPSRRATQQA